MPSHREFSTHPDRPDEHSDRMPSSDQAGPSRPARARALRFFGNPWENLQVSSNGSSTLEEQRLRPQEQREHTRREQQPLEDRLQRLVSIQNKCKKQLSKRNKEIDAIEHLMHKLECCDRIPHEDNIQKLDEQLYKHDLDILQHIGSAYMLEKRLERLEQQIPQNQRNSLELQLINRIQYIERFDIWRECTERPQNKLAEMTNWLEKQMKSRLGRREQRHLYQMMDKLRIELKQQNMKIEDPMNEHLQLLEGKKVKIDKCQQKHLIEHEDIKGRLELLGSQKKKREYSQQKQLYQHEDILYQLDHMINALEHKNLDIRMNGTNMDMVHDIEMNRIEKDALNLDKWDRKLKESEQWLEDRKLRLLDQLESGPYNRLQKLEQLEEDNNNKWNEYNSWFSVQQSNIVIRIEDLPLRRLPQNQQELLRAAKRLNINLPALHTEEWTKFLHHVYEDPGEIRLDPNQAEPLNSNENLMLGDIISRDGTSDWIKYDQRKSKEYRKLTELLVKKYQEFHNQGNGSAQS